MKKTELLELENIVKSNYSSLCAVAYNFVGTWDIAQDITQEVIIKYWEKKDNYEEIKSLQDFLFIMVRNESLNYIRGYSRMNKRYEKLEIKTEEEPRILNLLIEEETNHILAKAIDTLPLQMARIMRYVLSGYENKEIAQLMGVSINTIKTLKYSAIRKLREYFESHYSEIKIN